MLLLPRGSLNWECACGLKRNRATSLIINVLILMRIADNAVAIRVNSNEGGGAGLSAASGYVQSLYGTPSRDVSATNTAVPQASRAYANYVGTNTKAPTRAAAPNAADRLEHFRFAGEEALPATPTTATGFVPTALTAAGQHYAAAQVTATTNNDIAGVGYATPKGRIDYEINAGHYDSDGDSDYAMYDYTAAAASLGDLSAMQRRLVGGVGGSGGNSGNGGHVGGNSYLDSGATAFKNYFTPGTYQAPNGGQYLRDYEIEPFSNYKQQQQQKQQQHQHPQATSYANTELLQKFNNFANPDYYANIGQLQQQQSSQIQNYAKQSLQQAYAKHEQPTAEPSQRQLQVADSSGRTILQAPHHNVDDDDDSVSGNTNKIESIDDDTTKLQSQYYYTHSDATDTDAVHDNSNSLQLLQHQLHQQQQQFAQLQQQLLHHDQQLQQQHHLSIASPLHDLHSSTGGSSVRPLPPITTTVHHTPTSSAAVAGIPLGRHVEVVKHVPAYNYQQLHVPFNHTVPIEIPRPVITTVPRPFPIHVPVPKTIAVPQLKEVKIPIEKVKPFPVERHIPYIVERRVPYRVEKQVATPFYYPYPIKVPVVRTVVHKVPAPHHHHHRHAPHLAPHHYASLPQHFSHTSAGFYTGVGGGGSHLG